MHRTDDTYRKIGKHGAGKDGFTEGSPGVEAPTNIRAVWLDAVQEEIATAIEDAGLTLDSGDNGQLSEVLHTVMRHNSATAFPSASGLSAGDRFALTSYTEDGVPAPGSSTITPTAGIWLVSFSVCVMHSSTANPKSIGVALGVSQSTLGDTELTFRGLRLSGTATDWVRISGTVVVPLGAVAGGVYLAADPLGGAGTTDTAAEGNYLTLVRLQAG